MLTQAALTGLREHFMNRVAYAQYTVNDRNETARIESASILADGRISISLIIAAALDSSETVTEVRLYDASDVLLAQKPENISREIAQDGIYYRFFFRIEEV